MFLRWFQEDVCTVDQLGTRLMQIWRRVVAAECFPYLTRWLALTACFHAMPRLPSHNKCLLQLWLPLLLTHLVKTIWLHVFAFFSSLTELGPVFGPSFCIKSVIGSGQTLCSPLGQNPPLLITMRS
ncbi:hypothetical protein HanPSC8_Chr17g0780541 [Helianthus annuus]|nr:hypothetical protein HanPSC8_Chr17g0780541 [Helianthus annuus]